MVKIKKVWFNGINALEVMRKVRENYELRNFPPFEGVVAGPL